MRRLAWMLAGLALILACVASVWIARIGLGPQAQADLSAPRIFAYRDWQTVGVQVQPGDMLYIRAQGRWLYTPGEFHGPEGHASYPAPDTYPVSGYQIPGGVLLGRIGEDGDPFIVGSSLTIYADHVGNHVGNQAGTLFFRINDDILSDNEGFVTVEVEVVHPTPGS